MPDSKKKTGRNHTIPGIALALVLSGISLVVVFKGISGVSFQKGWEGLRLEYLLITFGVLVLVWCSKAARMYVVARGLGVEAPFYRYFQIYLATCFISHVTPFSAGGTPLQLYLLERQGMTLGQAAAVTAMDLGLHTLLFLLLIPVAVVANLATAAKMFSPEIAVRGFRLLLPVLIVFLVLGLGGFYFRLRGWPAWGWLQQAREYAHRRGWGERFWEEWRLFGESWSLLIKKRPFVLTEAIFATVGYWFLYLAIAPLIILALGEPASFFDLMGRQLFFNVAQVFIPTPGGSGGAEILITYLFKGVTVAAVIGPFVLLWRFFTYFSSLIVGAYYLYKLTGGLEGKETQR